jgi:hypothetical protein
MELSVSAFRGPVNLFLATAALLLFIVYSYLLQELPHSVIHSLSPVPDMHIFISND